MPANADSSKSAPFTEAEIEAALQQAVVEGWLTVVEKDGKDAYVETPKGRRERLRLPRGSK